MATTTIVFGILLIVLGAGGGIGADRFSLTALIPGLAGSALVVFGAMAWDEKRRKMAMHFAVTVGLLGFLGTVAGLLNFSTLLLSGGFVERPAEIIAQSITSVLMAVYMGMCVKSFIDARRRRAAA